jgi:uracil-DNA glycosylase family 4
VSAELMVIAEVPWRERVPAAQELFDGLLVRVGISPSNVVFESVLEQLTPGDRDPLPEELEAGSDRVFGRVVEETPLVIVPLGSLPSQLLTASGAGIVKLRGQAVPAVFALLGYWLLPMFPPTWAVRTKSMRDALRADVDRLPELLGRGRPDFEIEEAEIPHVQLGLFGRPAPVGVDG